MDQSMASCSYFNLELSLPGSTTFQRNCREPSPEISARKFNQAMNQPVERRFNMWPEGSTSILYQSTLIQAKRHISGWAMRNTNNHNINILKKSCLGVLVCSNSCVKPDLTTVAVRPAICDKARKKQLARRCPNNCGGSIVLQVCKGHKGFPVTHFWKHTDQGILFISKGTHDHPRPQYKLPSEKRLKSLAQSQNGDIRQIADTGLLQRGSVFKDSTCTPYSPYLHTGYQLPNVSTDYSKLYRDTTSSLRDAILSATYNLSHYTGDLRSCKESTSTQPLISYPPYETPSFLSYDPYGYCVPTARTGSYSSYTDATNRCFNTECLPTSHPPTTYRSSTSTKRKHIGARKAAEQRTELNHPVSWSFTTPSIPTCQNSFTTACSEFGGSFTVPSCSVQTMTSTQLANPTPNYTLAEVFKKSDEKISTQVSGWSFPTSYNTFNTPSTTVSDVGDPYQVPTSSTAAVTSSVQAVSPLTQPTSYVIGENTFNETDRRPITTQAQSWSLDTSGECTGPAYVSTSYHRSSSPLQQPEDSIHPVSSQIPHANYGIKESTNITYEPAETVLDLSAQPQTAPVDLSLEAGSPHKPELHIPNICEPKQREADYSETDVYNMDMVENMDMGDISNIMLFNEGKANPKTTATLPKLTTIFSNIGDL